jgi:hypothetical protein
MNRIVAIVMVSCGVLGCASTGRRADDSVTIPFTMAHGLIFLDLYMPSNQPVLALLDTGASASAIDPRCARSLPTLETSEVVGTTGTLGVQLVMIDGLRLGSRRLPPLRATRRDLDGLLAPDGRSVGMILGSDALSNLVVTLDFATSQIGVAGQPVADLPEGVPMILDNGIPAIEGNIGGIGVWLRIDTGASLFETADVYVNIPTRIWKALRSRHEALTPTTHFKGTRADGQSVDLPVAPVSEARVGPMELDHVFVIVQPETGYFADPEAKGFVSNNFLRRFGRVTLDYRAGRLR